MPARREGRLACRALMWGAGLAVLSMARPAQAACTLGQIAALPVTMMGARPLVAARIEGRDVRFVADSGAFYSLISPDMAAALKLAVRPTNARLRGIGGTTTLGVATVKHFTLAGVDIPRAEFIVGGSTTGVAGLLGQNILGFADVEYDLADGMIRLFKPQRCSATAFAYWAGTGPYSMLPIDSASAAGFHTRGIVTVNGVRLRAVFDTGAGRSVIDLPAAARLGIRPGGEGVVPIGYQGGLGTAVRPVWRARFASFRIGDNEEVRSGWVAIGKLDLEDADMLIGADFFLSHRVYVSNSQHRLFLTYDGGPAFAAATGDAVEDRAGAAPAPGSAAPPGAAEGGARGQAPAGDARAAPADADGFARRGAARAARADLAGGLADLDEAVRRAPDRADLLLGRARLRAAARRQTEAVADLDRAIALGSPDPEARLMRARLRLAARDRAGARADLDAAAAAMAPQDAARRRLAALYVDAGAADRAVPQYDLWIAAHREDSGLPDALNGRCWARALLGTDLGKALGDCDAALRRRPGVASFLDSRGLVHLRRGELDRARADYDAALAGRPDLAWSLYGRALVERRAGQTDRADADRAAARALVPDIDERARRIGLAE